MNNTPDDKLKLIKQCGLEQHYNSSNWEELNRRMFDELAYKYDRGNLIQTFGNKKRLDKQFIANIPIPSNANILDLCTGSGDIAIALANAFPNSQITAVDISPKMLEQAKSKAKKLSNIRFIECSALQLPFEDETFDVVVISFGLRNLESVEHGTKEMIRVTKPGGFISNIDQGKPKNRLINFFYKIYFHKITPLLGKLFFNQGEYNSFRYLPESNNYFPAPDKLMSIFKEAGLVEIQGHNFFMGAIAQQVGQKK